MNKEIRALSVKQEHRLVAYLDESFIELTKNYHKRSEPDSSLACLENYLAEIQRLLSIILQISPIDPSTSLRTAYLLKLSNVSLNAIIGYPVPQIEVLSILFDFLDDLDQAWIVALHSQLWDPIEGIGIDLVLPAEEANNGKKSSPLNTTERARLRSVVLGGIANLQEWVTVDHHHSIPPGDGQDDVPEVQDMLERMGLGDSFQNMFSSTLSELGGFEGGGEMEDIEMCLPPMSSIMADGKVEIDVS